MSEKNLVAELIERAVKGVDVKSESESVVGERVVNDKGQAATVINSVTVMTVCGGGEYGDVKPSTMLGEKLAGGAVTVKSVKPQFFLVDNGKGFELINGLDPLSCIITIFKEIMDKAEK